MIGQFQCSQSQRGVQKSATTVQKSVITVAGEIWERLRTNLAGFLPNSIFLNKIHHYWEVPTTLRVFMIDDVTGVNLKFLRKK